MGYRLHYAKHFAPDWQGGYFSGGEVDAFERLYYSRFAENGWMNEHEDQCEIDRDDIARYILHLKKLKPENKNYYMKDYTNAEFIEIMEDLLNSEDEMIRMEWF